MSRDVVWLRTARAVLVAGMAVAGTAGPLLAQVRRGPPAGRPAMERQVRQRFEELVVRDLRLSDEQARELASVLRGFQQERQALVRRELDLRRRLLGSGALLPEEEALDVLEELSAVQEEEARLLRREQARLLEFLSPPQVARLYALRGELGERIRRLRGVGAGGTLGAGRGGGAFDPER